MVCPDPAPFCRPIHESSGSCQPSVSCSLCFLSEPLTCAVLLFASLSREPSTIPVSDFCFSSDPGENVKGPPRDEAGPHRDVGDDAVEADGQQRGAQAQDERIHQRAKEARLGEHRVPVAQRPNLLGIDVAER